MRLKDLHDALVFNKRERKGIILLMVLLVFILLMKWLQVIRAPENQFPDSLKNKVDSALALGFLRADSVRVQDSIRYQAKRDSFWVGSKISRWENSEYKNIKRLKKRKYSKDKYEASVKKTAYKKALIELNTADKIALESLRGVGPTYANRIIKYRDFLGGFCMKEQLLEVYGIDSLNYNKNLKSAVKVNFLLIKKININSDSIKILARHPYVSWELAQEIYNYRKENGDYIAIEELRLDLLNEEIYSKIAPYLKADVTKR